MCKGFETMLSRIISERNSQCYLSLVYTEPLVLPPSVKYFLDFYAYYFTLSRITYSLMPMSGNDTMLVSFLASVNFLFKDALSLTISLFI